MASPSAFTAVAIADDATLPRDVNTSPRDTWPQQFFVNALPRASRFVNLATGPLSTSDVLGREASVLPVLHARVAVVLVGLDDVAFRVPPAQFGQALTDVLAAVHKAGVARVLVGTLPAKAGSVLAAGTPIALYDDEIRTAVRAAGAVLVDVAAIDVSGAIDASEHVFYPDSAGHKAIADAFTRAYQAAYPQG